MHPRIQLRSSAAAGAATLLLIAAAPAIAQEADQGISPGDVVRIDREVVGTLMSIENARLTVLTEGKPRCWPGIGHGDAPRCDPVPAIRQVFDWRSTTVERQQLQRSYAKRTIVGFILGAAAGAPFGYATGPTLGYGEVDACYVSAETPGSQCPNPLPQAEVESLQRARDQKRGALFFGAVVGTAGAIIARRLADDWVEIRPPGSLGGEEGWTLGVRLRLEAR